ncbi:MAG: uroporphyrinogen decarboxylase family protein [Candidatus Latescibacteria bacterium]|nr:uroporphyrinogen decarboxylase family protein [Candidatus Latescibacterota bacterium]
MTSRERVRTIIAGEPADRCGFWLGNPHADTWPIYHNYFGTTNKLELQTLLGDDFRWIPAGVYRHPSGHGMFHIPGKTSHGFAGPFAACKSVDELDAYEWPKLEYLDFEPVLESLRSTGDVYRASGFWAPFYHNLMNLFGMENYMMNMHLNPELVQATTDRVCSFYYEANARFFEAAGNLMDGYFFGNDFGTQLDLICGPEQFDTFILPWFQKFIDQAHSYGYQVILHSCGSIYKVIDRLICAGVECLHPLQAKARDMQAETLASSFKGRIAFLGGIDTQDLLVNATPDEVRAEVLRVKEVMGPCLIISPSHEALLPNVPPENVLAMSEEARA